MIRRFVFCMAFLFPSFCFGQAFVSVLDPDQYPTVNSGESIPLSSDHAVLKWSYTPASTTAGVPFRVLSAEIVPTFTALNTGFNKGTYGYSLSDNDSNVRYWYSVISPSTIYLPYSSQLSTSFIYPIQELLVAQNLGTVQQRSAYIAGFKVKNVSIVDTSAIMSSFSDLLGPWSAIAIGFAIALFCLEFGTRNTKQLAGDAAKEARASDRRVVNREIRDDPIAGQFRAHMDNLASVMRNTYGYHDASTRAQARDLFEQAARDYASYKKSRGWTV